MVFAVPTLSNKRAITPTMPNMLNLAKIYGLRAKSDSFSSP